MVRESGFGEGPQRLVLPSDATAFTGFMLDLYDHRCAVTGQRFAPGPQPHPDLEVFLFQPLDHSGALSPGNAIVVDVGAAGLLAKGVMLINDHFEAYVAHAEALDGMAMVAPRPLQLPEDRALWPQRQLLAYHRSLFLTQ